MARRVLVAVLACALLGAAPLSAQERPVELGVDATLSVISTKGENDVTVIDVPNWLRVGVHATDRLLVESALSWHRSSSGGGSGSAVALRPSVSWLWGEEGSARPYLGAGFGVARIASGSASDTQWSLGVAGGVRIGVGSAGVVRFEAGWDHAFESDYQAATGTFRLGTGISVRLR